MKTNKMLEDYALRYTPHRFRRWSSGVVAITALGGIAYLADFSIGASISIMYGTINAIFAILCAAILIFLTGLPLAYYGSRYNIDLDLITRGAGFGYYGSILTSIIFASFTFIFFALEGSIMAQGLYLGLGIPLWLGYLLVVFIVLPLVIQGMKALTKLQVWTTPIWLMLMFDPVIALTITHPETIHSWLKYSGNNGVTQFNMAAIVMGSGIALSLMGQIGEQIDYLRFMPAPTKTTKKSWWIAVIAAGPGWVGLTAIKQLMGAFLAVYALKKMPSSFAIEPIHQFLNVFSLFVSSQIALILSVALVIISQIKINVTNAYSGSLAFTNAYTRITKHYPGRLVFVFVNLAIALTLMECNMFAVLASILSFYSNCAIAWVVVVATDIVVNKYILGISPKAPEYRRGQLYAINPVGFISFISAAGLAILAYFGVLGHFLSSYSPLIALTVAFLMTPLLAILTKGRYYLLKTEDGISEPRFDEDGTPSDVLFTCVNCSREFERPDVLYSEKNNGIICSLCKATER